MGRTYEAWHEHAQIPAVDDGGRRVGDPAARGELLRSRDLQALLAALGHALRLSPLRPAAASSPSTRVAISRPCWRTMPSSPDALHRCCRIAQTRPGRTSTSSTATMCWCCKLRPRMASMAPCPTRLSSCQAAGNCVSFSTPGCGRPMPSRRSAERTLPPPPSASSPATTRTRRAPSCASQRFATA